MCFRAQSFRTCFLFYITPTTQLSIFYTGTWRSYHSKTRSSLNLSLHHLQFMPMPTIGDMNVLDVSLPCTIIKGCV
jgi:hypothetical protein